MTTEDIFSYIPLAVLFGGGIWGIYVKIKEFSKFLKENGWQPVRKKIRDFFAVILRVTIYTLIVIGYLSGFLFLGIRENENYANLFIFAYLAFGVIAYYYANGIKRKNTKNILLMLSQDFIDFKSGIKEFTRGFLMLAGWLLALGAIILAFVLFGWLVASLSATTIIIILLVLILLK